MAKLLATIPGDIDRIARVIEKEILSTSSSASLEDKHEFIGKNSKSIILVFERYSYTGGNRLSLSVSLFQEENLDVRLVGISAGGSNGIIFKFNTIGENAFLDKLSDIIKDLRR